MGESKKLSWRSRLFGRTYNVARQETRLVFRYLVLPGLIGSAIFIALAIVVAWNAVR